MIIKSKQNFNNLYKKTFKYIYKKIVYIIYIKNKFVILFNAIINKTKKIGY